MAAATQSRFLSFSLTFSPSKSTAPRSSLSPFTLSNRPVTRRANRILLQRTLAEPGFCSSHSFGFGRKVPLIRPFRSSIDKQSPDGSVRSRAEEKKGNDWTTSFLLFGIWAGIMFYVFKLSPNQTPVRDMYFLQKLLNLKGEDGFRMNEVLVALWYIMGLWPLLYTFLLIPSGRR